MTTKPTKPASESDEFTKVCPATGTMLPEDAKADYLADSTCTHFYCAHCNKLLRLPNSPHGLVRKHMLPKDEGEKWPFAAGTEPDEPTDQVH